jgi:adenine-specific DNA-methyltransferase
MRLIGNKTRLLGEIERLLAERGLRGGTLIDIFSGTSSVGRHFKRLGFRVIANDRLSLCYTQAVAGLVVSRTPRFEGLLRAEARVFESRRFEQSFRRAYETAAAGPMEGGCELLHRIIHYLNFFVPPRRGLISRSFCPGGAAGRRYFQDENGRKIDGILHLLRSSRSAGLLEDGELHLLLSALIDAADRVANISGTYGAFLKEWQPNALKPLLLAPPEVIESALEHRAYREDANELIGRLEGDILYIDPPYNHRQYAANYHVLDVIAEHHRVEDLEAYERALYGKTGLRPYERSAYCVAPRRGSQRGDVQSAMLDLVLSSRVRHVVVSYNEEGILSRDEIGAILARFSGARRFDFRRGFRRVSFKRFRSDSDRGPQHVKGARSYRVIHGRGRDELHEWLFFASRAPGPRGGGKRARNGTVAARLAEPLVSSLGGRPAP